MENIKNKTNNNNNKKHRINNILLKKTNKQTRVHEEIKSKLENISRQMKIKDFFKVNWIQ